MPNKDSAPPPSESNLIPVQTIDAGEFGEWLAGSEATQVQGADADVPCGSCNACCRSSYFIHITPEDKNALSAIPEPLLFSAPGLPAGHFVMGYNEHGECPMLLNDRCSIYLSRPQTCRAYDCRIFSAAGMAPGEADKSLVLERTAHWTFSYANDTSRKQHAAVTTAANWLKREQRNAKSKLPDGFIPSNSTQQAVLALQIHALFEPADVQSTTQAFADQVVASSEI